MVYKIGILFTWDILAMPCGILEADQARGLDRAGTMATGGGYAVMAGGWVSCFSTEKTKKG